MGTLWSSVSASKPQYNGLGGNHEAKMMSANANYADASEEVLQTIASSPVTCTNFCGVMGRG